MLGFAEVGMQEGKSENEERRSRGGLYTFIMVKNMAHTAR
jgi:hypothetical protein